MKTYSGSCHCGAVRYQIESDLKEGMTCNCSMCGRKGTVLTFLPADKFKLLSGEANLTDYLFNKKQIHHLFCKTCGVTSFCKSVKPDGAVAFAVNVRCLDNVDLESLNIKKVNGKAF